jgi:hypothetical protein
MVRHRRYWTDHLDIRLAREGGWLAASDRC